MRVGKQANHLGAQAFPGAARPPPRVGRSARAGRLGEWRRAQAGGGGGAGEPGSSSSSEHGEWLGFAARWEKGSSEEREWGSSGGGRAKRGLMATPLSLSFNGVRREASNIAVFFSPLSLLPPVLLLCPVHVGRTSRAHTSASRFGTLAAAWGRRSVSGWRYPRAPPTDRARHECGRGPLAVARPLACGTHPCGALRRGSPEPVGEDGPRTPRPATSCRAAASGWMRRVFS